MGIGLVVVVVVFFWRFYGPRRSRGQQKRKRERGEYPAVLAE